MAADNAPPDLVADLLLRFYREPVRYREQMRQVDNVVGDLGLVLRLAAGRQVELTDPALTSVDPEALQKELKAAAAFHIQQVFFRPDASHYQVLGLRPDAPQELVREHFRLLMQLIHPDRLDENAEWPESFATRANAAYAVLKHPDTRKTYDEQLAAPRAQASVSSSHAMVPRRGRIRPNFQPQSQWWSERLGAFVRDRPATAAFSALFAVSAAVLGGVALSNHEPPLTRDGIGFESESEPASPSLTDRIGQLASAVGAKTSSNSSTAASPATAAAPPEAASAPITASAREKTSRAPRPRQPLRRHRLRARRRRPIRRVSVRPKLLSSARLPRLRQLPPAPQQPRRPARYAMRRPRRRRQGLLLRRQLLVLRGQLLHLRQRLHLPRHRPQYRLPELSLRPPPRRSRPWSPRRYRRP